MNFSRYLLTLFATAVFIAGGAKTFTVDGIVYQPLASLGAECEVVYSDSYSGSVVIPSQVYSEGVSYNVTAIGDYAFAGCSEVTAVSVPAGVSRIGRNAFERTSLTEIDFPKGVREIADQTFYGCSSLMSFSGPGVAVVGMAAFSLCKSLADVKFGNLEYIDDSGFSYCSSLRSISLPPGMTLGSYVFSGCRSLESVELPSGLAVLPDYTFSGCSSLDLVAHADALCEIGDNAFHGCTSLSDISLGPGLQKIGRSAFGLCQSLSLDVIEGVGLVIGDFAFEGCTSLVDLALYGVVDVGTEAFANNERLERISFDSAIHDIRERAFRGSESIVYVSCLDEIPPLLANNSFPEVVCRNAVLVVPQGASLIYRQTPPWNYFLKIEEYRSTGMEENVISGEVINVSVAGRLVTAKGCSGPVSVYDGSGRKVYEALGVNEDGFTFSLPGSGVYVLVAGGTSKKIVCR